MGNFSNRVLVEPSDVGVGTLLVGNCITTSSICTVLYKGEVLRWGRGYMMFNCLHAVFVRLNECELAVKSRAIGTQISLILVLVLLAWCCCATLNNFCALCCCNFSYFHCFETSPLETSRRLCMIKKSLSKIVRNHLQSNPQFCHP